MTSRDYHGHDPMRDACKGASRRVRPTNVRRLFERAITTGDDDLLLRVKKYLVGQGWAGGITIEEAIAAVER